MSRSIKSVKSNYIALIVLFLLMIVMLFGYFANIYKFLNMINGEITAQLLARGAGIFFVPLGSLLGFM